MIPGIIDWQRIWNDDAGIGRYSPTRTIAYALSLPYRLIINLRNWLFDQEILTEVKLSCPVISVGNITAGGTGKTPCVIWLAKMLQEQGYKPAVLSRGYGGKSRQAANIVSDGQRSFLDSLAAGDEPLLIAQSLPGIPVITGPRRIVTGKTAITRFGATVLICDDALQHRQIFRDINIVLLDSKKPLGNGHVLPRGELREPQGGICRASCFVLTRCDEQTQINEIIRQAAQNKGIPIFQSVHKATNIIKADGGAPQPISDLRGKRVCAFCGIARPDSFKELLLGAGAEIISFQAFPDHFVFSRGDLGELKGKFANQRADYLITTQKDVMRLQSYSEFLKSIHMLSIEMQIIPSPEPFQKFILEKLAQVVDSAGAGGAVSN